MSEASASPESHGPATAVPASPRIVVLCAGSPLAAMFINGVRKRFPNVTVLREEPESKWTILRRRGRLVGWPQALGQAAFGVLAKFIGKRSAPRLAEIMDVYNLDPQPHCKAAWIEVGSVNSEACRAALVAAAPDVVLVYGTRIIKKATLQCVPAPFINYHAGYNPLYRGQHGAYWALVSGDRDHAGLTVHLVDEGVDTGAVLYQSVSQFAPSDNITTYQYRQMADAIPLMITAAEDALAGRLQVRRNPLPSKQWFMPTLWGYCRSGLSTGVW
jgi:folate-dependent phosphoribosylglycinamide formyltransferase PurN